MALTPDQLTREYYSNLGYSVTKVEGWKIYPELRRCDFLGIYDYLAFNDHEILAIQTTTKSNMSSRRKKMLTAKSFARWTKGNRRSILIVWHKERGRWKETVEELYMKNWDAMQAKIAEENNKVDTDSDLYKMLFPNGTAVPTTKDKDADRM